MVEVGPSSDGAELPSFQEALAFAEKPRAPPVVQRSLANARRSDSKLMGLFGGFRKPRRASEVYDRPKTKAPVEDFDATLRRKRAVAGGNETPKRIRRDDRKGRRTEKLDFEDDGFVTEAPIDGEATGADDVEIRREERRAKRASRSRPVLESKRSEPKDEEAQRSKRQEVEDDARRAKRRDSRERRIRREEEEAEIRREERRAKRAARDERPVKVERRSREGEEADIRREEKRIKRGARDERAFKQESVLKDERPIKEEQLFKELDPNPAPERRSKRRDRDIQDRDRRRESTSRPRKPDRRRWHIDSPRSPGTPDRRPNLERRRSSHRRTPGEISSHSRRRSSVAPPAVDNYFDPRNGSGEGREVVPDLIPPPTLDPQQDPPYMHSSGTGANDHTSSWVKSQISEPPPPPPVEPSVLDPAPVLGPSAPGDDCSAGEDTRAMRRKSRRQSRYADGGDAPAAEPGEATPRRRRREGTRGEGLVRSSEGSAEYERDKSRRKSDFGPTPRFGGGGGIEERVGGGGGSKRGSWFQKIRELADGR